MNSELLTPAQAAERLQVSKRTLLNLARQGRIAVVKIGYRTLRFHPQALGLRVPGGGR